MTLLTHLHRETGQGPLRSVQGTAVHTFRSDSPGASATVSCSRLTTGSWAPHPGPLLLSSASANSPPSEYPTLTLHQGQRFLALRAASLACDVPGQVSFSPNLSTLGAVTCSDLFRSFLRPHLLRGSWPPDHAADDTCGPTPTAPCIMHTAQLTCDWRRRAPEGKGGLFSLCCSLPGREEGVRRRSPCSESLLEV